MTKPLQTKTTVELFSLYAPNASQTNLGEKYHFNALLLLLKTKAFRNLGEFFMAAEIEILKKKKKNIFTFVFFFHINIRFNVFVNY